MEKALVIHEADIDTFEKTKAKADGEIEKNVVDIDYSSHFTINEVFKSREKLVEWIREVGRSMGMIIVIHKSETGGCGKKARVRFACERNGFYAKKEIINKVEAKKVNRRSTGTKKCGCPFALKGNKLLHDDGWLLEVIYGKHNHPLAKYLEGHSFAGKLSNEQEAMVVEMSQNMVPPRAILSTLKQKDNTNASTMRAIYNTRYKFQAIEKAGRSQIQQLMHLIVKHHYVEYHRSCHLTGTLKELFWAHPGCFDLLRAFPHVLILDCTYKTNRYRLPLLEMVGVTSTNLTFSVAYAYLHEEKEDNYHWALSCLKATLGYEFMPDVIVTDRELALINAINVLYPKSKHLLCRWHISRNVETHCKRVLKEKEKCQKFYSAWDNLVYSITEEDYEINLTEIETQFNKDSSEELIEYVKKTWLNPFKERFVSAWTDLFMHFGNYTTNRAESSHAKLKRYLRTSISSFDSIWSTIHSLLLLQHTEVKASFEKSMHITQHIYKPLLYSMLRGFVSKHALELVVQESEKTDSIASNTELCECSIRRTHGLPCKHEISNFKRENLPIPISSIHPHWTKLDMLATSDDKLDSQASVVNEIDLFMKMWNEGDEKIKMNLKYKLREIVLPASTSLSEPPVKCNPKGRPPNKVEKSTRRDLSAFEYLSYSQDNKSTSHVFSNLPPLKIQKKGVMKNAKLEEHKLKKEVREKSLRISKSKKSPRKTLDPRTNNLVRFLPYIRDIMHPFIIDFKNVNGDGNCGYRCIADHFGWSTTDGWIQVRGDLLIDLEVHKSKYCEHFGSWFYEENKKVLQWTKGSCGKDHWMQVPDMGYLAASAYNCVIVLFTPKGNNIFVPHAKPKLEEEIPVVIPIALVESNHFVRVVLTADAPMPPIASMWYKLCTREALTWQEEYADQIARYISLLPKTYDDSHSLISIDD